MQCFLRLLQRITSNLKEHTLIIYFCRFEVIHGLKWPKSRCEKAVLLLEALEENPLPSLFQILETARFPWLLTPSNLFKAGSC